MVCTNARALWFRLKEEWGLEDDTVFYTIDDWVLVLLSSSDEHMRAIFFYGGEPAILGITVFWRW
jgi:hypothetical protein